MARRIRAGPSWRCRWMEACTSWRTARRRCASCRCCRRCWRRAQRKRPRWRGCAGSRLRWQSSARATSRRGAHRGSASTTRPSWAATCAALRRATRGWARWRTLWGARPLRTDSRLCAWVESHTTPTSVSRGPVDVFRWCPVDADPVGVGLQAVVVVGWVDEFGALDDGGMGAGREGPGGFVEDVVVLGELIGGAAFVNEVEDFLEVAFERGGEGEGCAFGARYIAGAGPGGVACQRQFGGVEDLDVVLLQAGVVVAQEEVVGDFDLRDVAVLDEEALGLVVVLVVVIEGQIAAAPDALQGLGVVAELVQFVDVVGGDAHGVPVVEMDGVLGAGLAEAVDAVVGDGDVGDGERCRAAFVSGCVRGRAVDAEGLHPLP